MNYYTYKAYIITKSLSLLLLVLYSFIPRLCFTKFSLEVNLYAHLLMPLYTIPSYAKKGTYFSPCSCRPCRD